MINELKCFELVINNKYDTNSRDSFIDFPLIFIVLMVFCIFCIYHLMIEFKARFYLAVKKRIQELESKQKK